MTTKSKQRINKPTLRLIGNNENAFVLLGLARSVAKRAGWSEDTIKAMSDEAMSGDYDHLLQTLQKHFHVPLS